MQRSSRGLGRGLGALIPVMSGQGQREVPLEEIRRNPHQPRERFQDDELQALAASIAEHGVLQPVLVSPIPGGYQLIAGERRVRAAAMAGLTHVPVVVRTASEQEQLGYALIENLQRSDLNAIEEARAFRRLSDEFGLTQDEIARRVGRSRPSVANTVRLLQSAPAVQRAIEEGRISEGHGRAIASLATHHDQQTLLRQVIERELTVRQVEQLARGQERTAESPPVRVERDPEIERLERRLSETLATKVTVAPTRRGGRITIEYYNGDDLERLYDRLAGAER